RDESKILERTKCAASVNRLLIIPRFAASDDSSGLRGRRKHLRARADENMRRDQLRDLRLLLSEKMAQRTWPREHGPEKMAQRRWPRAENPEQMAQSRGPSTRLEFGGRQLRCRRNFDLEGGRGQRGRGRNGFGGRFGRVHRRFVHRF